MYTVNRKSKFAFAKVVATRPRMATCEGCGGIRWQTAWANVSHCQAARMYITRERVDSRNDDALATTDPAHSLRYDKRDIRDTFNGARDAIFIHSRRVIRGAGGGQDEQREKKNEGRK